MQTFRDDDDGYVTWLANHPDGFVVNAYRNPNSSYLRLHRTSCYTISKDSFRGASWTATGYMKACAQDLSELEHWGLQSVGGELDPCKTCKPL